MAEGGELGEGVRGGADRRGRRGRRRPVEEGGVGERGEGGAGAHLRDSSLTAMRASSVRANA